MFDFRYHALSLAAVFIALVVGLLLGVAIGDKELVSSARKDLRADLRAKVREANNERDAARVRLREQEAFADAAYPILAGSRLQGDRVGLVLLGDDDGAADLVRRALEPTGADLAFVAVLREDVDVAGLAELSAGTRYARLERDPTLLDDLGKRAGIQMVLDGRLVRELRPRLLKSLSVSDRGGFGDIDGVVVVRPASAPADRADAQRLAALQDGIARGLVQTGVKVVGIERRGSQPSSIGWFRDRDLSSVDNVDEQAGKTALVFVLAGNEGSFGRRDDAQGLLPPVVGHTP